MTASAQTWQRRIGLDSLQNQPFRTYFTGRTISTLGGSMVPVALAFAVFASGGGTGALGLVIGVATLPKLVLVLVGGVAGDRFRRRRVLLTTDVSMAVVQGVTSILLLASRAHIWQLAVLQCLYGCASAFAAPATIGVVRDLSPADLLQQANALVRVGKNLVSIVGPALSGVLIAFSSPGWVLLIDAATFTLSAYAMSRLPSSLAGRTSNGHVLLDALQGWRAFTSLTWIWVLIASFAVYQATTLPVIYVLGPKLAELNFRGATSWALVLSARSIGGLLVGVVLLRWRPRRPLVAACFAMFADVPFLLLLGYGHSFLLLLLAAAISAAAVESADTFWETTLQEQVPPNLISRISSYDWLGSLAIAPLGYILIGTATHWIGLPSIIIIVSSITVVTHIVVLIPRSVRSIRRSERAASKGSL